MKEEDRFRKEPDKEDLKKLVKKLEEEDLKRIRREQAQREEESIKDLPEELREPFATFLESMAFPWRRDPVGAHPLISDPSKESPFEDTVGATRQDAARADAGDIVDMLSRYAKQVREGYVDPWAIKGLRVGASGALTESQGKDMRGFNILEKVAEYAKGTKAGDLAEHQLGLLKKKFNL